jgi:uncharacterized DUF497 family protein
MRDDDFEWDDEKAISNFAKHGVTFEQARAAFDDPNHIEVDSPDLHEVPSIASADMDSTFSW